MTKTEDWPLGLVIKRLNVKCLLSRLNTIKISFVQGGGFFVKLSCHSSCIKTCFPNNVVNPRLSVRVTGRFMAVTVMLTETVI